MAPGRYTEAFQEELAARSNVHLSAEIELSVWCGGRHSTGFRRYSSQRGKGQDHMQNRMIFPAHAKYPARAGTRIALTSVIARSNSYRRTATRRSNVLVDLDPIHARGIARPLC